MTESAYGDVLVPTDGSDLAERALAEALTVAELSGGTVHVLYVVDDVAVAELATDTGIDDVTVDGDLEELFERLEHTGRQAVADLRDAAAERGVDVVTAIRRGLPDDEILDYADEEGIDLVVMGTHGRRGVERYLLGSTTERVLRRSTVPVLAVRQTDD